ncbi:MAG: TolC family protein [Bacteroidota bacterium]
MRQSLIIYCLSIGLSLGGGLGSLFAQEIQGDSLMTQGASDMRKALADSLLGFQIAPLDTLILRATANAPELSGQDALIESRKARLKTESRYWMKMFQPILMATYGNGTISATVDDVNGTTFNLANRQTLVYSAGFTVRFTAEDIFNRKNRAQILEHEIDKLYYDKEVQKRMIRERVIMRYEALLMAAEVMTIKQEQYQSNLLNQKLAERYLNAGDMTYADYNAVLRDMLHSEIQFLNVKSDFQKYYLLLRETVGGPIE